MGFVLLIVLFLVFLVVFYLEGWLSWVVGFIGYSIVVFALLVFLYKVLSR